jgi:hypothetical protein
MPLTVQRDLQHRLRNRDCNVGQSTRVERPLEIRISIPGEPIQLHLFGRSKAFDNFSVRARNPFFGFIDKGLVECKQQPISVGDENMVEEFAEFSVFGGRGVLFNRAQKVEVGPPLVTDKLVDHVSHGVNLPDRLFSLLAGARRNPVLEQDKVQEAVEFIADFGKIPGALEAEPLEKCEGDRVF